MTASSAVIRVIDDDASWRTSAARLLSAAGYRVAVFESAERFLEAPGLDAPGCVLLDVRMPGSSGLELQRRLVDTQRGLPIVFLSGHGDIPMTVRAMKAGADDFLTKPVASEVLLSTVARAVARDIEDRAERESLDALRSLIDSLTPTERKVFDQVVQGKLNKRIAADLGMSERTVKWHRHNFTQKLRMHSVAELVSLAQRLELIEMIEARESRRN